MALKSMWNKMKNIKTDIQEHYIGLQERNKKKEQMTTNIDERKKIKQCQQSTRKLSEKNAEIEMKLICLKTQGNRTLNG